MTTPTKSKESVYVIYYETESCDRGVMGSWKTKPTEKQVKKLMEDYHTEDYPDNIEWQVKKIDLYNKIEEECSLVEL